MKHWKIGLDAWIIQDGNYPDFDCGSVVDFALEFSEYSIAPVKSQKKSAIYKEDKYHIIGEVVHISDDAWVIDFGILAYQEGKAPGSVNVGSYISAEIYLGVDPFPYIETLCYLEEFPYLIYSWKVERILIQSAPLIESISETGRKTLVRDKALLNYKEIKKTNAWDDDEGFAEYVLECSLLSLSAKGCDQIAST